MFSVGSTCRMVLPKRCTRKQICPSDLPSSFLISVYGIMFDIPLQGKKTHPGGLGRWKNFNLLIINIFNIISSFLQILTFAVQTQIKMSSHERAHEDESNNVTYQRCQFAYEYAIPVIKGKKVLDVGCGNAYGTALMAVDAEEITGFDYDRGTIEENKKKYGAVKNLHFVQGAVPPLPLPDACYDVVTAFQFIEHIENRKEFLKECIRVLKPGGVVMVTTPNIKKSLARNPFHIHEYTFDEMKQEINGIPSGFELLGLKGNEKVNTYYAENGKFVRMILKFDIFGLHKRLPASWLTAPYNFITSLMRNKLKEKVSQTTDITTKDFYLDQHLLDDAWDIYLIARK